MNIPKRIQVMHVITGLGLGGAETMLHALVTGTDALEQSVVSLTSGGYYADRLRQAGASVTSLNMKRGVPTLRGLLALSRLIAGERPDIVQGWMYHADLAALLGLCLSGRRRQTKLIWGLRASNLAGTYGWKFNAIRYAWLKLSRYADLVVANSNAGLRSHPGIRAARVIPNGIDTDKFRPDEEVRRKLRQAWGVPENIRLLVHVARVDSMKDHATFLRAIGSVPMARALLVGRGTDKLDLPANVTALGARTDLPDILSAGDIIVSSSAFGEGFSNSLAEGMATGLPAIATDVGDARQIVGDTGLICPPRDQDAMIRAIRSLVQEPPAQWRQRSLAARQRIVEAFSLKQAIAEFALTYRDLLAQHRL